MWNQFLMRSIKMDLVATQSVIGRARLERTTSESNLKSVLLNASGEITEIKISTPQLIRTSREVLS